MASHRLLFVMNAPIIGGAELHTVHLSGALAEQVFASDVFSMKAGSFDVLRGSQILRPSGVRSLNARILDLRRSVTELRPDIVVAINERPLLAAHLAVRLFAHPPPIVSIYHTTVPRSLRSDLQSRLYFVFFNKAALVVFVSGNQRSYWLERGMRPRESRIIRNGVDLTLFSRRVRETHREATRARLGIGAHEFTICHNGMMRPEKNHRHTLLALAVLRNRGIDAKLIFVGDGPMRPEIERSAQEMGLLDDIVITGVQNDVRPFIAAADVSVVAGGSETLSLAALESMAMGVPVAMGDISGASEIVDGRNGRLYPVGDVEALGVALADLSEARVLEEAGRAARRTVEERFDISAMIASYAGVFRHVAAGRGGADRYR